MLSNKPRLHAQLQKHNKSYWKVKTVIWLFFRGWGHLNSFSARWGGNLNKNFPKVQMPGGLPGGDVEPSIWLVHNVALAQWRENPLGSTEFCGIRDQNSHHFWNQGSRIWVKIRDQRWKNIPRYDPAIMAWRFYTPYDVNRTNLHVLTARGMSHILTRIGQLWISRKNPYALVRSPNSKITNRSIIDFNNLE